MLTLPYKASVTGSKFLVSTAYIKVVMGPVGGGKSTLCLMDLVLRATTQRPFNGVRRTKFIILRNTMQQLKTTVKPLIDQWLVEFTGGACGQWKLTENTFVFTLDLPDGTKVVSDFVLMAADTPDDVRRLLSVECSAAWVEEAREVDPVVFDGLQGRVRRFPSVAAGGVTYPGVICSTNPPPVGSFWHEYIVNPPKNAEVFIQPPALLPDGSINPEADNLEHLAPGYYEDLAQGKSPDWVSVYLMNEFGAGDYGQPVFKSSFKKSFHTSDKPLQPILGSINPLIVGMDNGLQAAAVFAQQDMRGRVNVLAEAYVPQDRTMGVETFLDTVLTPVVASRFATFPRDKIVFVVDPACFQRSQVDEKTIAQAIAARGYKVAKAVTNDPERRIQAVESLLCRQIDGGPGLLIDPSCQHIISALDWGYRWKKGVSGLSTPEKNHFSHIADALQYACSHYGSVTPGKPFNTKTQARPISKASFVYA